MDWVGGKTRSARLGRLVAVALLWLWIFIFELIIGLPGICRQPVTYCIDAPVDRVGFTILIQIVGIVGGFAIMPHGRQHTENRKDSTGPTEESSS